MLTNTNAPRQSSDNQELRLVILLLALTMGLLVTASAVYLALVHPSVAEPLAVGAAVLGALPGAAGIIARVLRRWR